MSTNSVQISPPSPINRIEKWVPGLHAIRHYQLAWMPRDLVAGLVLSALLVPQGMAYAELKDPVKDKIERYGLFETIDRRHFYPTIEVAIEEFHREWQPNTESAPEN